MEHDISAPNNGVIDQHMVVQVVQGIRDFDKAVRAETLQTLKRLPQPALRTLLRTMARNPNEAYVVRCDTSLALFELDDPAKIEVALHLLADPDHHI
jgi:HEAT repeat protein